MNEQRVARAKLNDEELADGRSAAWQNVAKKDIDLMPAPVAMVASVSPYLSQRTGHGKVKKIGVQAVHNGTTLSIRLSWHDPDRDDELEDLDQFADAVAVMFPLASGASALTMGSTERPINAWLWMADESEPYDVLASGYATSLRRAASESGLRATAYHENDRWTVVLQRPLQASDAAFTTFEPGTEGAIALAVWEGSNKERSAQKAISGEFAALSIDV